MNWQVFINDEELVDKVVSASAKAQLDNQNNDFSLKCIGMNDLYHFSECRIQEEGQDIIGGLVMSQSFDDQGLIMGDVSCVDYNYIFQHRMVAKVFSNRTVSDILIELIQEAAPEFTTRHVRQCPKVIPDFTCNYITLSEAIKQLLSYVPEYHYYIDGTKDFHLFQGYETTGPSFSMDEWGRYNFLDQTLSVNYDAEGVIKRVWIIGAKQPGKKEISQFFKGDGQQRYFNLAYKPNDCRIFLNGVLMSSGPESEAKGTEDFLINSDEKIIIIPDTVEIPYEGEIDVRYRPTIQVIEFFEDHKSDYPFLLEKAVRNKDVTDKMVARQYGKAEVKRAGTMKTYVSLATREPVRVGQKCYVKIDEYHIDGQFLVTSVTTQYHLNDKVSSVELEGLG